MDIEFLENLDKCKPSDLSIGEFGVFYRDGVKHVLLRIYSLERDSMSFVSLTDPTMTWSGSPSAINFDIVKGYFKLVEVGG